MDEQALEQAGYTWHPYQPFEKESAAVIPPSIIPESIRPLVTAVSEALEVPVELPLASCLGVASAVCQSRWGVYIREGWIEPTSLFIAVPADPGERKTPTLKQMIYPLIDWEKRDRDRCSTENEASEIERTLAERQIKALERKADRADDVSQLAEQIKAVKENMPAAQKARRLFVDDTTPERLLRIMSENDGSIAAITDEGGAFLKRIAGSYNSGQANIDGVLKGWDNGPIRVDRSNGNNVYLDHGRLSVTLLLQKSVARDVLCNKEFMDRGLVHRFLWLMPGNDHIGSRTFRGKPVPDHVKQSWALMIDSLLSWAPAGTDEHGTTVHGIQMDDDAFAIFERHAQSREAQLKKFDEADPKRVYRQKWPGQVARIAGVLHCLDMATKGEAPHAKPISADMFQQALGLSTLLLDHADVALGMLGQDSRIERALRVFRRLKSEGEAMTTGQLWRSLRNSRKLFSKSSQVGDALELLAKRGYVAWRFEPRSDLWTPAPATRLDGAA